MASLKSTNGRPNLAYLILEYMKVFLWPLIVLVLFLTFKGSIIDVLGGDIELELFGVTIKGSKSSVINQLNEKSKALEQSVAELSKQLVDAQKLNTELINENNNLKEKVAATMPANGDTEPGSHGQVELQKSSEILAQESTKLYEQIQNQVAQTQRLVNESNFEQAKRLEMSGFDQLIERDFKKALSSFKQAYTKFPEYHNVDEIQKLLDKNMDDLLDPKTKNQATADLYTTILEKYSWGMTDQVKSQMIGYLEKFYINNPEALRAAFYGPRRREISNRLAELYDKDGVQVINALVSALLPDGDKHSYRVNLYVARTLARIKPFWEGTAENIEAIKALKKSGVYDRDETFRNTLNQAIDNCRNCNTRSG